MKTKIFVLCVSCVVSFLPPASSSAGARPLTREFAITLSLIAAVHKGEVFSYKLVDK